MQTCVGDFFETKELGFDSRELKYLNLGSQIIYYLQSTAEYQTFK